MSTFEYYLLVCGRVNLVAYISQNRLFEHQREFIAPIVGIFDRQTSWLT